MNDIYYKISDKTIRDSEIIHDIEDVKKLLGFNINWIHKNEDRSLLMGAVLWNRKELVRYLLTFPGINVNQKNSSGKTALIFTCSNYNVSILRLLLSHRYLNVNIQDDSGYTILHQACTWGCEEFVAELLSDVRVNMFIRDKQRKTVRDIIQSINKLNLGTMKYLKIMKIMDDIVYKLLRIFNGMLCMDIIQKIVKFL